jgi:hypothetical protein
LGYDGLKIYAQWVRSAECRDERLDGFFAFLTKMFCIYKKRNGILEWNDSELIWKEDNKGNIVKVPWDTVKSNVG